MYVIISYLVNSGVYQKATLMDLFFLEKRKSFPLNLLRIWQIWLNSEIY